MPNANDGLVALAVLGFALVIYFLPWIVAASSHKRDTGAILVLNLFAGWTAIGWLVALVWACTHDRQSERG